MTERGQAFLYHTATRNFFAWMFGKSLVGTHLGGALVGLLNSMNEFRSEGEDNVQAIMDYMDEEGYADMRNQPDHALAILSFAEHFHFKDLWIDAFAHCVGMHEILICSPGFEVCSIFIPLCVDSATHNRSFSLIKAWSLVLTLQSSSAGLPGHLLPDRN